MAIDLHSSYLCVSVSNCRCMSLCDSLAIRLSFFAARYLRLRGWVAICVYGYLSNVFYLSPYPSFCAIPFQWAVYICPPLATYLSGYLLSYASTMGLFIYRSVYVAGWLSTYTACSSARLCLGYTYSDRQASKQAKEPRSQGDSQSARTSAGEPLSQLPR